MNVYDLLTQLPLLDQMVRKPSAHFICPQTEHFSDILTLYRASGRIVDARKMNFCAFKLRYMQKKEQFLKPQDVNFFVKPRNVQKSQK